MGTTSRKPVLAALALCGILVSLGALAIRSPIDPLEYRPPEPPPLSGALEPDESLRSSVLVGNDLPGPEDVAVDDRGRVYCGLADGTIRRRDPDSAGRFEVFASTGGRPQGLDFDASGLLWVADVNRGLLSVAPDGSVTVRATEVEDTPVGFANDVAVAADGKVYFSDSSTSFGPETLMLEALEARPHGRLLEHDPDSGQTRVVLDGLYFANGVAVAPQDRFVLVTETFRYRVRRVWLRGPDAGRDEVLVDNLPGFPDGVASDGTGTFWVAIYGLRSTALDRYLHPRPWAKRMIAGLPWAPRSGTEPYGLVIAFDSHGRIVRSLHDPGGETISHVTSVEPHGSELYLGTIETGSVGRYSMP